MSEVFAESILSLTSGLHSYAGDPNKLKLRIAFTEPGLLSARPTVQAAATVAATKPSIAAGSNQQQQQRASVNCDPRSANHSSFLLAKHDEKEWTIRPEKGCLLAESGGTELLVVSERLSGLSRSCRRCGFHLMELDAIDSRKFLNTTSAATTIDADLNKGGMHTTFLFTSSSGRKRQAAQPQQQRRLLMLASKSRHQFAPSTIGTSNEVIGEGLMKRKRAIRWKDTTTMTSDNDWQRTLARKLPYEMRNHRQDYHQRHCAVRRRAGYQSRNLPCTSCYSRSDNGDNISRLVGSMCLDCGGEIGEHGAVGERGGEEAGREVGGRECTGDNGAADCGSEDESCMLTDWYQRWLLNRKRNLDLSSAISGVDGFNGQKDSGNILDKELSSGTEAVTTGTIERQLELLGAERPPGQIELANRAQFSSDTKALLNITSTGDNRQATMTRYSDPLRAFANKATDNRDDVDKDGFVVPVSDATSSMRASDDSFVTAAAAASAAVIAAADKINKQCQQEQAQTNAATATATATAAVAPSRTCSHCSHGEILYVLLIASQRADGAVACVSVGERNFIEDNRSQIIFGSGRPVARRQSTTAILTADATVSTGQTRGMDKTSLRAAADDTRNDDCESKVQKRPNQGAKSRQQSETRKGSDAANADEQIASEEVDKLGYKGTIGGEIRRALEERQIDPVANSDDNNCESSGIREEENGERKINQTRTAAATVNQRRGQQWLGEETAQNERLLLQERQPTLDAAELKWLEQQQQDCWVSEDSNQVLCLAVIVIDVLNGFIQLKPDLGKPISLESCTKLALYSAVASTLTRAKQQQQRHEHIQATARQHTNRNVLPGQSQQLLYSLELVGDQANEIAEAERELNLVHEHLLSRPASYLAKQQRGGEEATSLPAQVAATRSKSGFLSPVNGSMLIKLQFDIHFASDFSSNCRNLYVKYKLLAKGRGSGTASSDNFRWKLRRLKVNMKGEMQKGTDVTVACDDEDSDNFEADDTTDYLPTNAPHDDDDDGRQKLAQLTHLTAQTATKAAAFTTQTASSFSKTGWRSKSHAPQDLAADDELEEPGNTRESTTLPCRKFSCSDSRKRRLATNGHDTCLLEGSTITSLPNSRGQFHFACVEQLLLELSQREKPLAANKWSGLQQQVASDRVELVAPQLPMSTNRQKSFELLLTRGTNSIGNYNNGAAMTTTLPDVVTTATDSNRHNTKVVCPDENCALKTSPVYDYNYDDNERQQQRAAVAADNASSHSLPDAARSQKDSDCDADNNRAPTTINDPTSKTDWPERREPGDIAADGGSSRGTFDAIVSNVATDVRLYAASSNLGTHGMTNLRPVHLTKANANDHGQHDRSAGNSTGSEQQENNGDEVFEIVFLFELYSTDFYRDRLQGWSHLSVPVCLDRDLHQPSTRTGCAAAASCGKSGATNTRYELPVILPELRTPIDKLRYYLIGQLPKSASSLKNFARTTHRYMLQTRQSGKLVLDCEVARQFSDPNFDIAFRDVLMVGKQSEQRKERPNNFAGPLPMKAAYASERHLGGARSQLKCDTDNQYRDPVDDSDDQETNQATTGTSSSARMDTEGVVEAYRRAKLRIDRLNMMNPALLPTADS